MSGEYGYIVRLLRKVEFALTGLGRQREAGRMGQITQRIAGTDDVRGALRLLARVEGYGPFAYRLLYYTDTMGPLLEEPPDERLTGYHVEQLMAALRLDDGDVPSVHAPPAAEIVEQGERFSVMARGLLADAAGEGGDIQLRVDDLARNATALGSAARRHGEPEIERYAASAVIFLRYAAEKGLLRDIRVANILDHAGLALSSALAGRGEDDSLTQTTRLLADPATLLD